MDAQKASYSITLMAKVLGVTRAGYYAWKNRAPQRGRRASARRRLDEAVAWEHEVSGGTYGAPRIRHALARAGVDVGVRAVAASMRRQGLTGLNTHPRPSRRGGRGPVAHEDHCARQWDQGALDRVWITDFTYLRCAQGWVYLCAVRDAHSRRVLGYAMGEQQSTDLVITAQCLGLLQLHDNLLRRVLRELPHGHLFCAATNSQDYSEQPSQNKRSEKPRPLQSQQRANRSHQRNHRTGQTHRQRLPQPHQLPTPNAPHRRRPRRLHPHPTMKSP